MGNFPTPLLVGQTAMLEFDTLNVFAGTGYICIACSLACFLCKPLWGVMVNLDLNKWFPSLYEMKIELQNCLVVLLGL